MQKLNLKKYQNSSKTTFSMYVYDEVLEQLRIIADNTGVTIQNLIRHSLNETLDKLKVD